MKLADFIESNLEIIFMEWERFARSIWPGTATDPATLRDHVEQVLRATIADMKSAQTSVEQSAKSKGDGLAGVVSDGVDAASELHGADRAKWGFDVAELVAEYRALRASVLRLWAESLPVAHSSDLKDLTRFNESIDQSLTEAVSSFSIHHRKCQDDLAAVRVAQLGAEEANRSKDIFLSTLSHELRTPLNAIVGWLEILSQEECSRNDLAEGLTVINRNTKAQIRLIEDILDLSRIASGKLRLEVRLCNLDQVIQASITAARPMAQAKGITLEVNVGSMAAQVSCDPVRLQQVLWNLLSNAVKFTAAGGTISVSVATENKMALVSVQDNGAGIPAAFLPQMFDRFRQADDGTRRKAGGLGLGLSIARHLMELHGGTVEARSAGEGQGSTFTISLPVQNSQTTENDDELEGKGQTPSPPTVSPVRLDGLRLLLVDDETDTLRVLSKLLRHLGALVTTADSAASAIGVLGSTQLDVLVSDIGMPGQDGYDLIREVRRRGFASRDLPAVAVTAFVGKDDQRKALMAGFQVHVPKPVDLPDLTAVIASLAGRTG